MCDDNAPMEDRPDPGAQPGGDRSPAGRGRVRRLTWLLLLLLAVVGIYAGTWEPSAGPPGGAHYTPREGMPTAPEPQRASGQLAVAYQEARPAAVKVESRCGGGSPGRSPIDVGSGFFVSPQGHLLTAYHVIRRQTIGSSGRCSIQYLAVAEDEEEYPLELLGFDAYRDVALLKADVTDPVPYLELASSPPSAGSEVVAIGNSRGEFLGDRAGTVTRLGVSAAQPEFASGTIELTAAVAPGDSGGPVIGVDGRALGVVSYISFEPSVLAAEGESLLTGLFRRVDVPQFASYAVPVSSGSEAMANLYAGERRDIPVIGFQMAFEYDPGDPGPALGSSPGVVVGRVQPGGPADRAGLRSLRERTLRNELGEMVAVEAEGDVIVSVDGKPTSSFRSLLEAVRDKEVGDPVTLLVQRGSSTVEVELELAGYRQIFD